MAGNYNVLHDLSMDEEFKKELDSEVGLQQLYCNETNFSQTPWSLLQKETICPPIIPTLRNLNSLPPIKNYGRVTMCLLHK